MDKGAHGISIETESEDKMKKHIKQAMSLCLAGTVLLTTPSTVKAAQATETQESQETQETTEVQENNKEAETTNNAESTENTTNSTDAESADKVDSNSKEQGTNTEQNTSTDANTETPIDTGAMEEKGEVTEPITKEDKPYLALGANLTAEQQATVLELLGIKPEELSDYDVIYVTNDEEHQYLGKYVSSDKIGTRSLSSVLVVKREEGHGINITTKNISYCTIGMYKNALITAGITDADIIVAGPTPISGTAALVGALKAYSVMTGEEVSEESMDAALNELVVTGDIAQIVGDSEKAEELLAYLKQDIIENGLDSKEDIQKAIKKACDKFDITLNQDEIDQLTTLLMKIKDLDLDLDTMKSQAQSLYDKLADMDAEGLWDKIVAFFQSIIDFFKNLF